MAVKMLLWLMPILLLDPAGQLANPQTRLSTPTRRALLIGVSEYSRGGDQATEWWNLASASDVAALHSALVARFAFDDAHIVTLTTRDETTRASIFAHLDALLAEVEKGDIVYVHYSGHGTPVADHNGDEFDGLDETIVPSDYISRGDGGSNITDDEIGAWLAKLAAREPTSVFLSFDSCFSGSQTRGGLHAIRGGNHLGGAGSPGTEQGPGLDVPAAFARGYVVLSAARHDQVAEETYDEQGGAMGLLTYTLVRQLYAAGPSTTYRDLFDGVLAAMARRNPGQVPQLEGELDELLLSGGAAAPAPYVEARMDQDILVLQAGSLHGVTIGSVYAIYPSGTRIFEAERALTTARVSAVHATSANLVPDADVPLENLSLARAVEISHSLPSSRLQIDIRDLDRVPFGADLRRQLEATPGHGQSFHLSRAETWDLKLCAGTCPEELRAEPAGLPPGSPPLLTMIRQDGSVVARSFEGGDLPEQIARAVEIETRWQSIARLDHRDPRVDVQVRLVPATVLRDTGGAIIGAVRTSAVPRSRGRQPVLAIGDHFMIELRHTGTVDAFVTVLDLSPDGAITPLWPHPSLGSRVQENRLRAPVDPDRAAWILVPYPYVFQVGPPAGRELVKVIATDTPSDFSNLFQQPDVVSRNIDTTPHTQLGERLASAVTLARRAASPQLFDPTIWSSSAFAFLIEPTEAREGAR